MVPGNNLFCFLPEQWQTLMNKNSRNDSRIRINFFRGYFKLHFINFYVQMHCLIMLRPALRFLGKLPPRQTRTHSIPNKKVDPEVGLDVLQKEWSLIPAAAAAGNLTLIVHRTTIHCAAWTVRVQSRAVALNWTNISAGVQRRNSCLSETGLRGGGLRNLHVLVCRH